MENVDAKVTLWKNSNESTKENTLYSRRHPKRDIITKHRVRYLFKGLTAAVGSIFAEKSALVVEERNKKAHGFENDNIAQQDRVVPPANSNPETINREVASSSGESRMVLILHASTLPHPSITFARWSITIGPMVGYRR